MNFLRPEFLSFLPLAAVPIVIHLLSRRRHRRLDFSAMDFLRRAQKRVRRRLFLEDLLLLLLRTAAVILFILALARPGSSEENKLTLDRPSQGLIVVMDTSLSMGHRQDGQSSWERARAAASSALAALDGSRGDQAALILASPRAQRIAIGHPTEVGAACQEERTVGSGLADWAGALATARKSAAELAIAGCDHLVVRLYTDLQASSWEGELLPKALDSLAADGVSVFWEEVGDNSSENWAIVALEVDPAVVSPGESVEVRARVRGFHTKASRTIRGRLFLDDAPIAEASIEVPAGGEAVWSLRLIPPRPGRRALELRLEPDSLAADDSRAAILEVRTAPRLLLLSESPGEGVAATLMRFLDLGEGAPVQTQARDPATLGAADLVETDLLILADLPHLPMGLAGRIAQQVRAGMGLWIVAGPALNAPAHAELLALLDGEEVRIGPMSEADPERARLQIQAADWPPLALFQDPRWLPLLTEIPVRRWRSLDVRSKMIPLRFLQAQEVLGPAAVHWRVGRGQVLVLACAPLPGWNAFAEVPGGTLPFLFDLAHWSATAETPAHTVESGSELLLALEQTPTEILLRSPQGTTSRPLLDPLASDRAGTLPLQTVHLLGTWIAELRMPNTDSVPTSLRFPFAVVPPPGESDLARMDADRLEAITPLAAEEDRNASPLDSQDPLESAPLFFILVAAALAIESMHAGRLDRKRG